MPFTSDTRVRYACREVCRVSITLPSLSAGPYLKDTITRAVVYGEGLEGRSAIAGIRAGAVTEAGAYTRSTFRLNVSMFC